MVRQLFGCISADFVQIFVHIEAKLQCAGGLQSRFLKFALQWEYPDMIIHSTAKSKKITLKTPKRRMA